MYDPRLSMLFVTAAAAALVTCLPTEQSAELRVEMDAIPPLLLNDTVVVGARVLGADGRIVPNAVIELSTTDSEVISVAGNRLLAVGVGEARVVAGVVGFAHAVPAIQSVQVKPLVTVDSVRPLDVRFGDTVQIFGSGLDPATLLRVSIGGIEAPVRRFQAADPQHPDRFGILTVWVPAPAPASAEVTVSSVLGAAVGSAAYALRVTQHDVYEPNDTVPYDLGTLAGEFRHPALAVEQMARGDTRMPVDWYTFTTESDGDWTISVLPRDPIRGFAVYLSDSLYWDGASLASDTGMIAAGPRSWTIGSRFRTCAGKLPTMFPVGPLPVFEALPDSGIMALRGLPRGTYHLLVVHGAFGARYNSARQRAELFFPLGATFQARAARYELMIRPGYHSHLPPDDYEENDYCDVAPEIAVPGAMPNLTIDNPHDADWFRFTIPEPGGVPVRFSAVVEHPVADLDLYVMRDFRPDSLVLVTSGWSSGPTESAFATLAAGDYLLLVIDFPGVATTYGLTVDVLSPAEAAGMQPMPGAPGRPPFRPESARRR